MTSFFLLLSACDPQVESGEPAADLQVVPYIYDATEGGEPTLTLDDLSMRVDSALDAAWSVEATPVFDAYVAVMEGADGDCPDYYDYDGNQYWYDDCSSEQGGAFSGYAFYYAYSGTVIDGLAYTGGALYGVGSAETPNGSRFEFGGSASSYTAVPEGIAEDDEAYYVYAVNQVQGGFSYDGGAGDWLAQGETPDLAAASYWLPAYDGRYAYLDGAVGTEEAGATIFDGLTLYSENLMTACPNEPYGGISVRDENGQWYDILFHGPETFESEVDEALCDGCGDAYFQGDLMGQVCGDFAVLTDWEVTPWAG